MTARLQAILETQAKLMLYIFPLICEQVIITVSFRSRSRWTAAFDYPNNATPIINQNRRSHVHCVCVLIIYIDYERSSQLPCLIQVINFIYARSKGMNVKATGKNLCETYLMLKYDLKEVPKLKNLIPQLNDQFPQCNIQLSSPFVFSLICFIIYYILVLNYHMALAYIQRELQTYVLFYSIRSNMFSNSFQLII